MDPKFSNQVLDPLLDGVAYLTDPLDGLALGVIQSPVVQLDGLG